jgi:hypothetical protein
MESFTDNLANLLTRHEIRVAVCGMQNSGKTVFITALVDHLLHHDPERNLSDARRFDLGDFVIGDNADVRDLHAPGDSIGNFAFRKFRDSFGRNEWPEKTAETTELVLDFTLENRGQGHWIPVERWSHRRDIRLRILDVPGERMADLLMARLDYAGWSDAMLGNGKNRRRHLDAYRDGTEAALAGSTGESAEAVLLSEYRKALDGARGAYDRFVSPSVYRVPLDGSPDSPRLLGLAGGEFAPMTATLRKKLPALASRFARHYLAYRDSVVGPIVDWMKTADKALFLLDVFSCLNGGAQSYNGMLAETNAALDVLGSKGRLDAIREGLGYLLTRFQFPIAPEDIRIVVTKMDLADETGRDNLLALARQMFGKKAQAITGLKSPEDAFLSCAAAKTDNERAGGSETKKAAYPGIPRDRSEARPGEGVPWIVPEDLDGWKGRFPLTKINPAWFNLRDDLPPKHAGLDAIACFLLDIPAPPQAIPGRPDGRDRRSIR